MRVVTTLAFLVFATTCASCSPAAEGQTQSDAGDTPDAAPSFCASDPRALTFTPGLEQTGKSGALKAKLLTIDPAHVSKGDNAWTLQLLDATDKPIDGATLTIKPYMPDHGHGSAIVPLSTPTGSEGKYAITRLNLFMPGLWQITITADVPGSPAVTDAIVFSFCVPE